MAATIHHQPILASTSSINNTPNIKTSQQTPKNFLKPPSQNSTTTTLKSHKLSDPNTLATALDHCAATLSFLEGTQIHARIIHLGLSQDPFLSSKLLHFYSRNEDLDAARLVFDSTPTAHLNQFFFNTIIRAYVGSTRYTDAVELFVEMLGMGFCPNEFTYPFVIKSCAVLGLFELAKQIHGLMVINGYFQDVFAATALLDLYVKWGYLGDACKVFDRIPERNEVTWNSMVSGYAQNGYWVQAMEALEIMGKSGLQVEVNSWNSIMAGCIRNGDGGLAFETLRRMLASDSNVKPNAATFNTLLPIIPTSTSLLQLKELYGFVLKQKGIVGMDSVGEDRLRAIIAAGYANHGYMEYASRVFDEVCLKTCQLWISMISGFLDVKQSHKAFCVFRDMMIEYRGKFNTLSKVPLTLLLPECDPFSLRGLEIHAHAYRVGFESNTSISNALIAMYSKRGSIKTCERVFLGTSVKNIVSWNTMISAYINHKYFDMAFNLFHRMHSEGEQPDEFTLSSVLSGCAELGAYRHGVGLHGYVVKSGLLDGCLVVQNTLLDMYGKCGCIEEAKKLFDEMIWTDFISWNTIISCYGINAFADEAVSLFYEMQEQGWKPNRVTFIALLAACSHAGLVDKALHFFDKMTSEYNVSPDVEHYACIVDSLGRVGRLDEAYNLIKNMPIKPDDCVWGALLSGCRIHGNVPLAEVAARHLIELKPQHSGYHVLLKNIYTNALRQNDAAQVWADMKDMGVKKFPGYSSIEVSGEFHNFLTADKFHRQSRAIYLTLDGLTKHLITEGYSPLAGSNVSASYGII